MKTNSLIDKLIKECTTETVDFSHRFGNTTSSYFDKHKFAQLVAKECMKQCSDVEQLYFKIRSETLNFADKNAMATGEVAASTIRKNIKKKFK